ncbi:MAG: hydantoinase B/oxoprolinase family protein [Gammaproteobacteria bacterium]|nr:hydantoinase B/oxoprolinase family protein [Gammaproteobacteria bacterium]
MNTEITHEFDPVLTTVLANRFDGIVREMSNTLLRAARSAVIANARDFSCAIVTGDDRLLAAAEGAPVHIFGAHLQSASMNKLHDDISEGDAFLHNDPYMGNTHAADHAILVPVFVDGEHMFTACAKAHQADTGNSIPTTYYAAARDVYQEGTLIFPCVRIQRDYKSIDDIVRMCRKRIRVPDQWYGDFLASIGAARIAERRIKELCAKYRKETVKAFIENWFDYSERRLRQTISQMPTIEVVNENAHDPMEPFLPDGIPIKVRLKVEPAKGRVEIDLRDNIDCVDCGLNESEACAINNAVTGFFNCVDPDIPHNAGAFRCIDVLLRDNCVVGRVLFPHSCSMATTNVADRLINTVQGAIAGVSDGMGLAEGGNAIGAGFSVVSGVDHRHGGAPYVNQLMCTSNGGPASPQADGWVTYAVPVAAGLLYRDSIELDEIKHPMLFRSLKLVPGSGGAGRFRGGPASEIVFGPRRDPMTVIIPSDGQINPARGVRGGHDGILAANFRTDRDGNEVKLPNVCELLLHEGELLRGIDAGGGGYGPPLERDPARVLKDVLEKWETVDRARNIYGVVFGEAPDRMLVVDHEATASLRAQMGGRS